MLWRVEGERIACAGKAVASEGERWMSIRLRVAECGMGVMKKGRVCDGASEVL